MPTLHLDAGDRVVFTGELSVLRDAWIARVAHLGLGHGGVTRSTRVVVAADPDSSSGKAARARAYDIPVITEVAFDSLITRMEQRRAARFHALPE